MEKTIKLVSDEEAIALYGNLDERLSYAEKKFNVRISARNYLLKISGEKDQVKEAVEFFQAELGRIRGVESPSAPEQEQKTDLSSAGPKRTDENLEPDVRFFLKGKAIQPKSRNQAVYLSLIQKFDIVVSIGPAGTGKTYLAVAAAVDALKRKRVTRLILTRPAVEAGESLGFLPGDLYAKINPYLRPLYDALYDMMDFDEVARFLQRGTIEVAPLAYMRGRTLNDCFVILDEGQNCTHGQMKMFLTRLGLGSKAVVTGDITQIDLPHGKRSGLVEVQRILHQIDSIKFCYLSTKDVVRHKLVQDIVEAYEKHDRKS